MSSRFALPFCALLILAQTVSAQTQPKPKKPKPAAYTSAKEAGEDFKYQGEYVGEFSAQGNVFPVGMQVVADGKGQFHGTAYPGGLPGDGWNESRKFELRGELKDGLLTLKGDSGAVAEITATGTADCFMGDRSLGALRRTIRRSETLGRKPPEGAVVLFDGTSGDHFKGARVEDGLLREGITSLETFGDCEVHLEFRLSFMPEARGQGRSNSGVYLQGRHEVQILDSFGLEGEHNECGGIYTVKPPSVNMCFPPLSWQTYDIVFTSARFDDGGKKTSNARITVKHNGVIVQDDTEVPKSTTASPLKEGPGKGPLYIQNHRNPVHFRNIWVAEK